MPLQCPLAVVAPTLDAPVLAVLARADGPFTGRQVHKLAGRGTEHGVRNALQRLVGHGVVRRSRAGSSYLSTLNRQHLAAPHVIALARLRDELLVRWQDLIARWPVQPRVVVLLGSAARGDMRPDDVRVTFRQGETAPVVGAQGRRWRPVQHLCSRVLHLDRWARGETDEPCCFRHGERQANRVLWDAW